MSDPGPTASVSATPAAARATPSAQPASATPVSRVGVALMLGLLALVLAAGIAKNGPVQALRDLGFRSPAIAAYTLLLLSPILFEGLYHPLRVRGAPWFRRAVENLHAGAPYLIAIGTTMLVMRIENVYDLDIAAALGLDWTPLVHAIEGDATAKVQAFLYSKPLTLLLHFVYVTVYALYHVVAMFGFAVTGRAAMLRRFAVAWVLVYAIALPFYVLAPVNEVWTTNPEYGCYEDYTDARWGSFATGTEGRLNNACGDNGGIVQAISSINNCFPSLHNAFAWTLPMLLWRSGWRRAAKGTAVVALLISAATLELGIHWVTDLVAGVALAWLVTFVAVRFDYRLDHRLRMTGARLGEATWARDDGKQRIDQTVDAD